MEVANNKRMERVLIDTGVTASILSKQYMEHIETNTKTEASMYNGTSKTIFSTDTQVFLHIGLKKQSWESKVSETSLGLILSMDWIEQNIHNISFADWMIILNRKTFNDQIQAKGPRLEELKYKFKLSFPKKNTYLHIPLTVAKSY
jgi:predicted aspartyl protease